MGLKTEPYLTSIATVSSASLRQECLFIHGALKIELSTEQLDLNVSVRLESNWNLEVFLWREENRSTRRKTLGVRTYINKTSNSQGIASAFYVSRPSLRGMPDTRPKIHSFNQSINAVPYNLDSNLYQECVVLCRTQYFVLYCSVHPVLYFD